MKRFLLATFFHALTTLAALLQSDVAHAQVPQRISYQAAVHDAGGAVMQNSTVSMRFSLRQGSAVGPVVYQ